MILCHLCYAQKCVKRIEGDETGQKHCTGQYFDYWKCIDKHVSALFLVVLKFMCALLIQEGNCSCVLLFLAALGLI